MEFKPNKHLALAVESGDIERTRKAVIDFVKSNPADNAVIMEAAKYAEENIQGLWEVHDNKTFKEIEEWDKEYINTLYEDMTSNFSRERFHHLVKVATVFYKMYGGKDKDSIKVIIEKSDSEEAEESMLQRNREKIKWIAIGAGAAVAILAWGAYRRSRRQYE